MINLHNITKMNILRCYSLSWNPVLNAIVLGINTNVTKNLDDLLKDPAYMQKNLDILPFKNDLNGDIGFGGCFKNQGKLTNGFMQFLIPIPFVNKQTGDDCVYCRGTGKENRGRECISCDGTGKEHVFDYKEANTISASFTLLFPIICQQIETNSEPYQLMGIQTITGKEMHGGSLFGTISTPLYLWLTNLGSKAKDLENKVIEAMEIAFNKMWGSCGFEDHAGAAGWEI